MGMGEPSFSLRCQWDAPNLDGDPLTCRGAAGILPGCTHPSLPPCLLSAQGPLIFLSCVVLSKEVRRSLCLSCARCHHPPLATKATLTPVSAGGYGGCWVAKGSLCHGYDIPVPLAGLWRGQHIHGRTAVSPSRWWILRVPPQHCTLGQEPPQLHPLCAAVLGTAGAGEWIFMGSWAGVGTGMTRWNADGMVGWQGDRVVEWWGGRMAWHGVLGWQDGGWWE